MATDIESLSLLQLEHLQRRHRAEQVTFDIEIARLMQEIEQVKVERSKAEAKRDRALRMLRGEVKAPYSIPIIQPGMTLDDITKLALIDSLYRNDGDKKRVANELGIALKTVYNMLNKYGILDD